MKTNASLLCLALFLALPLTLCSQHSLGLQCSFLQREYVFDAAVYSQRTRQRLSYNPGIDYWYQFPDSHWAAYGALGFANYRWKRALSDGGPVGDGFGSPETPDNPPVVILPGPSLEGLGPLYYSDRYLNLRAGARFTIKEGEVGLFCLPYLGVNAYLNSRSTRLSEEENEWARTEKTERRDFVGAFRLAPGLGAGLSVPLAPRTHLYFMPRAELFFRGKIKRDTLLLWGAVVGVWREL